MSQQYHDVAEKVRAHFIEKEDDPDSLYHDDAIHTTHEGKSRRIAPQCQDNEHCPLPSKPGKFKKMPKKSQHLVHFSGPDEVHFVGPDAIAALAALQARRAELQAKWDDEQVLDGTDRTVLQLLRRLALTEVDGLPRLTVKRSLWADVVHALYSQGHGLTGVTIHHVSGEPRLNEKGLPT